MVINLGMNHKIELPGIKRIIFLEKMLDEE